MNYKLNLGYQLDLEHEVPAIYKLDKRFRHFYICGASGMGKSILMERMAHYDMSKGLSVVYIDPKGYSAKKLYHLADKSKVRYVSKDNPIILNPLNKKGYPLDIMIEELVRIIDVITILTSPNPESTKRMKELLNKSIKAFSEDQINFKYLFDFLEYQDVRDRHKFLDTDLQKYWKEFDKKQGHYYVNREFHDTAKSITSRIDPLLNNQQLKPFCNGENELYISDLLKNGQSLLVDISGLTPDNMIYVANLIFHAIATYILYDKLKIPLLVYVDEFQRVASDLTMDILEFGRDELVGFTLAHHSLSQMKKKDIIKSITSIVGNFAIFRCGKEESELLSPYLKLKNELMHLEKYQSWLKLDTDYILIETYPPILKDPPDIDLPEKQKEKSTNYLRDAWIMV